MKKFQFHIYRRIFFFLAAIALLIIGWLTIPQLIRLDAVKTKITRSLSQQIGGDIAFEDIRIGVFPKLNLRLHNGRVVFPQQLSASFKTIRAFPSIISFLKGTSRINQLELNQPIIKIQLADNTVTDAPFSQIVTRDNLRATLKALSNQLHDSVSIAKLSIIDGQANLQSNQQNPIGFKHVQLDASFSTSEIAVQFSSTANIADSILVNGWIRPQQMRGKAQIELTNAQPQKLVAFFDFPQISKVEQTRINFKSTIQMQRLNQVRVEVEASSSEVYISWPTEQVALENVALNATIRINPDASTITLHRLVLDNPALSISGALAYQPALDNKQASYHLKLVGQGIDVDSLRLASKPLIKKYTIPQNIFRVLKAGNIPQMIVQSQGRSLVKLFDFENIEIEGHLQNGTVFIPGADLTVTNVSGDSVIKKKSLEASQLSATHQNSQGRNGQLKLGLAGDRLPIVFQMDIDADAAQFHQNLMGWMSDQRIVKVLQDIKAISGRVVGRLTLSGHTDDLNARVAVDKFDIKARYQRLPFPIALQGNNLNFNKHELLVGRLDGVLSNSWFKEVSAVLSWKKKATMKARAQTAMIELNEMMPWLRSVEPSLFLLKNHKNIQGRIQLFDLNVKGPLTTPAKWSLQARGIAKNIRFDAVQLSSPVEISEGSFNSLINPKEERLTLQRVKLSTLDSSLIISGDLQQFKGLERADLTFEGQMQSPFFNWLHAKLPMMSKYVLQTPVDIRKGRLKWQKPDTVELSGIMTVSSGPNVTWNLTKNKQAWQIKPLVIQDQKSSATISLQTTNDILNFRFSGRLEKSTTEKLLVETPFNVGLVEGNFAIAINKRQPLASTTRGTLTGRALVLPWSWADGILIDEISLHTDADSLLITATLGQSPLGRFEISGILDQTENSIDFTGNLSADTIEWVNLQNWYTQSPLVPKERQSDLFWDIPIRAKFDLTVDTFVHPSFTWRTLTASIDATPRAITFDPLSTRMCGIDTNGRIVVTPQNITLAIKQSAEAMPLDRTLGCLWQKPSLMTGRFNYNGSINADGQFDAIESSLNGDMHLEAEDGRIFQLNALSKILGVLNATEIFRGTIPDLTGEGMGYKTLSVKGILENSQIMIENGIINGNTMDIVFDGIIYPQTQQLELTILIAPFKTVDFLIQNLPVINNILGGNLITVPIKASGNWNDPDLTYPIPSEIGSGLLGIMKRTLQLPFTIIAPESETAENDQ